MKKLLLSLLMAPVLAFASGAELHLDKAPDRAGDMAALQNGAKVFVNYCLNCHSASYMRYNRLKDIGLSDDQVRENLLFTADKGGEPMRIAMQRAEAKQWFGAAPPDLTVIARARASEFGSGADWLYTYLRTFYRDDSRPTGWNNVVFSNVGMPHVLWELQGEREPQYETRKVHGHDTQVLTGWKQITPGTMTPLQYDQAMGDLVGYLQWMAEPAQNTRIRVGVWVLIFLGFFTVIAWRLNAAFWKDVK